MTRAADSLSVRKPASGSRSGWRGAALVAACVCGCAPTSPGADTSQALGAPAGRRNACSLDSLETSASWTTCSTSGSNCGGEGGVGTPVTSTYTVGTFAKRKQAAAISIGGDVSYGTAYWFEKGAPLRYQVESLTLSADFYLPTGSEWEAIELDPQQVRGTRIFNFGLQANHTLGQWRFFDYVHKAWLPTGIPWKGITEGEWHTLVARYHTRGETIVLDSIQLDGGKPLQPSGLAAQRAVVDATYTTDTLSLGLQLDQVKSGAAYTVYYDKVRLEAACDSAWCRAAVTPPLCAPATVSAPVAGAVVGESVEIAASAPSCTAGIECYLDGDTAPDVAASGASLDQSLTVVSGGHVVRCNATDVKGTVYVTPAVGFTAEAPPCTAPVVTAPAAGASAGDEVELAASAPACITAIACYVDGAGPVATADTHSLDATVPLSPGSHVAQCNGWDATGAVHVGDAVAFTSAAPVSAPAPVTACGAPVVGAPAAGAQVGSPVALEVAAPSCITAIACYVDGTGPVVTAYTNAVAQAIDVAAGSHTVQCNGWDGTGAVWVGAGVPFSVE